MSNSQTYFPLSRQNDQSTAFSIETRRDASQRDHDHCELSCEHPQPFCAGMLLVCGLCWFFRNRVTIMVPCSREVCG